MERSKGKVPRSDKVVELIFWLAMIALLIHFACEIDDIF